MYVAPAGSGEDKRAKRLPMETIMRHEGCRRAADSYDEQRRKFLRFACHGDPLLIAIIGGPASPLPGLSRPMVLVSAVLLEGALHAYVRSLLHRPAFETCSDRDIIACVHESTRAEAVLGERWAQPAILPAWQSATRR